MPFWSPIRPGIFIRDELLTHEAAASELHRAYMDKFKYEINPTRPRGKKYHPMTYNSFRTYVTRAVYAGLIEAVREEPLEYPRSDALVGIRDGEVVPQTLKVYALTEAGRSAPEGVWEQLGVVRKE